MELAVNCREDALGVLGDVAPVLEPGARRGYVVGGDIVLELYKHPALKTALERLLDRERLDVGPPHDRDLLRVLGRRDYHGVVHEELCRRLYLRVLPELPRVRYHPEYGGRGRGLGAAEIDLRVVCAASALKVPVECP